MSDLQTLALLVGIAAAVIPSVIYFGNIFRHRSGSRLIVRLADEEHIFEASKFDPADLKRFESLCKNIAERETAE